MINYNEIEHELSVMSRRSKLYALVKAEMTKRGNWKIAPKGKPFKKGFDPNRKINPLDRS
jgi:hypothetical protein